MHYLTVVWKRCRDGALPICWPLLSCIIPTLFAYFLACHPYIFFTFLMIFFFLFLHFFGVNLSYSVHRCDKWPRNLNSIDSLAVVPSHDVYKLNVYSTICKLEPDEGPATLRTWYLHLCSWLVLNDFTWKLTTVLRQLHEHPSITKAESRLFLSIATNNELNAALYLRHKPWQLRDREDTVPAVLNSRFLVCTSLAPRPMNLVFGLGTRLFARMRTTFENGVLRNGQQPGRALSTRVNL